MRTRILLLTALLVLPASYGCAAKTQPQLTPAAQAAVTVTQIIKATDVLRDFAINANAQVPPVISHADTLKIVNWHESVVKTLLAVPSGWKATVNAGIVQLQADLPPPTWTRIQPYVVLVQTLISEVL